MALRSRWAALAAGAVMAALAGCVTLPDRVAFELRAPAPDERQAFGAVTAPVMAVAESVRERRAFDAHALPLAHGRIIVSETGGAMSLVYSLFAREYAPWVHAGIVAIEDGEAVVYEAVGSFIPLPGIAPTAMVSGAVRRVSVERFARSKRIVGLYALPAHVDAHRLVAFAREQHRRGTPFDAYFDTDDAGALYCTELVALALHAGGAAPIEPVLIRDNASLAIARDWLQLRSRTVYLAGQLIDPAHELARWSADLSPAQIDAYFAVKRELHRRFDAQARLGHLFRWSGGSLRLREQVQHFMDAALQDAAGPDTRDVSARTAQLAERHFGSAPLHTRPEDRQQSDIDPNHTPPEFPQGELP